MIQIVTHIVLEISYGFDGTESDNKKYWLVENSWKLPSISTTEHQNELPACNQFLDRSPKALSSYIEQRIIHT